MRAPLVPAALAVLAVCPALSAQEAGEPIADNSFLIEEAYNQERNVVQHIGTYTDNRGGGWALTFTDEWPAGGVLNQMSVGLSLVGDESLGGRTFTTLILNYRRQLLGSAEGSWVVSPRVSLLGDVGSSGGAPFSVQVNVPASVVLTKAFVSHWNLGATVGVGPATVNAGGSVVWLTMARFNLLVEGLYVGAEGQPPSFTLNPGARAAFNLGSAQLVPGISFPIDLGDSGGDGILLYLSLEHPFGPTE